MEKSALYHRPNSEYAYLYQENLFHLRFRTKCNDVKEVRVIKGDPYSFKSEKWYHQSEKMTLLTSTAEFDYWFLQVHAPLKRLQYAFQVVGNDGEEQFYSSRGVFTFKSNFVTDLDYYFKFPYFHEIDRFNAPTWAKETIWYQIFPDRFYNGDWSNDPKGTLPWGSKKNPGREDFYGGDLQGVIDKLDYLSALGINGIYFCPLFQAPSNHKYDTIDYYTIDAHFGTNELFKKLVEEAHKRGIRIMLDAVFNHIGVDSPQWRDVIKNQEKSKYVEWFHIHDFPVSKESIKERKVFYETFAFESKMPKLNTANLEVQNYLLDIATHWIKEYDIDAWRLDVADEVDHHFWKRFRNETTKIKKDFFIVGEVWQPAQSWLNGDEFHSVMNYPYAKTVLDFFARGNLSASEMLHTLNSLNMMYRQQATEVLFNCLDSHDTARLLTMCQGNKNLVQMILAFNFLQRGSPCIFYGTEIGLAGETDPDCRKCMIWEKEKQDLDMLYFMKEIIALRKKNHLLLSYGSLNFNLLNAENNYFSLVREENKNCIIGYFNRGEKKQFVKLPKSSEVLLSNQSQQVENHFEIEMDGFVIIKLS